MGLEPFLRGEQTLDEAASPRDGGSGLGGLCGLGGGWPSRDSGVIPWDFRPLWLEFFGPQPRKGITMSELRNRMIRDMQLAGLVEGTRREYLRGVRQLAAYYMVSPDQWAFTGVVAVALPRSSRASTDTTGRPLVFQAMVPGLYPLRAA